MSIRFSINASKKQAEAIDANCTAAGYSRNAFFIHKATSDNQFQNTKIADIYNKIFPILEAEGFPSVELFVLDYLFRKKMSKVYLPELAGKMGKPQEDFMGELTRMSNAGLINMIQDKRCQLYLTLADGGEKQARDVFVLVNRIRNNGGNKNG